MSPGQCEGGGGVREQPSSEGTSEGEAAGMPGARDGSPRLQESCQAPPKGLVVAGASRLPGGEEGREERGQDRAEPCCSLSLTLAYPSLSSAARGQGRGQGRQGSGSGVRAEVRAEGTLRDQLC